jgi:serine/threonine protein kinase
MAPCTKQHTSHHDHYWAEFPWSFVMAKTIGRYEILRELGRGGMAAVYLVQDPRLDRQVALKLMDPQLSADPTFAARFEREAKTVASLEHSAIVPLHDFGEADGWLYLVMRYMEGGALKESIARGSLTTRQAYNVVRRIGSALDKAHGRGIIHRDLKPANILLDEEREAYLSDFGIVKVARGDTEYLTQTGQTMGTFAYMSPEQLMGEPMDGRSDLYALGVVLYEMLAGKHPYGDANTTDAAMAVAHTQKPIPDIVQDNPALPPAFTGIIAKAMAKNAADRYATGRDLAMDMYRALTTKAPAARPSATSVSPAQSAAQKPAVIEQPPARSMSQQPAAKSAQGQPATVAAEIDATTSPPNVAKMPARSAPTEVAQDELPTVTKSKPLPTPLPRWIMFLLGVSAFLAGVWYAMEPQDFIGDAFGVFYWPIVGFLTGISLLTRPADWRWRLAVGALGLTNFLLGVVSYNAFNLVLVGLVGILIGLIQIVQGFRGAGMALAAVGAASAIIGGLMTLDVRSGPYGLLIVLCGIAAIVLSVVRTRSSSKAS